MDIFISSPYQTSSLTDRDALRATLGKANYSYASAMRKFHTALRKDASLSVRELPRPAYYSTRNTAHGLDLRHALHLGFYPPEEVRLLKGAHNVLCFAWEFSTLRTDAMLTSPHAFASQQRMLGLVDEIWTPSHYAAEVIERQTTVPVHVIPAPISMPTTETLPRTGNRTERQIALAHALRHISGVPLAILPPWQNKANEVAHKQESSLYDKAVAILREGKGLAIYLVVLNPHDARKGLGSTIEAFCRFAQKHPNALLIIKTSAHDGANGHINGHIMMYQLSTRDAIVGQYYSDHIFVTNDTLSDSDLQTLYQFADFYVCTSRAEGQNLPLQEAMASGVVPVSVDHTAMADYIDDEDAIVVPSDEVPLAPEIAEKYGLFGAYWYHTPPRALYAQLERSIQMSRAEYHVLSTHAAARIKNTYSPDAVLKRIMKRVRALENQAPGEVKTVDIEVPQA